MIRIRASSLSDYADCSARWRARNLDGLRLPASGPARLGTAIHRSTGAYDQARVDGEPISADDAAGVLVDTLQHPDEEVDWTGTCPRDAERAGLILHSRYCNIIAPDRTYTAVELACRDLEVDAGGVPLLLTGTADRIRSTQDGLGVSDLKTGARVVDSKGAAVTRGHGMQLALYELLAEHTLGERMAARPEIIALKTEGDPDVRSAQVRSQRESLVGAPGRPGLLEAIAQSIRTDTWIGNPRSLLCSPKYCPAYQSCKWRE